MPNENDGAAAATPGTPAAGDQADSGAQGVDLEAEVGKAARKAERDTQKRVSLDLFENPDQRKLAERLQSQAVTDYRKKLERGDDDEFVRKSDFEKGLRQERELMRAEAVATEAHREMLMELDIRKGTEDYEAFSAAAVKFLDKKSFGDRAAMELLAKGLGVGKFKTKREIPKEGIPFSVSTGVPLRAGEGGQNAATTEVEAVRAMAAKARR